jgi:hypothetical protein
MNKLGISSCLIVALSLAVHTTAMASPCSDAVKNYNRIARSSDDWYFDAFEKATGIPAQNFNPQGAVVYCSKLLPVLRERLRRMQAVMKAYYASQNACPHPHYSDSGRVGLKTSSAPSLLAVMKTSVEICERSLAQQKGHVDNAARLDVGSRTCSNQRDRCVSYRNQYGPVGSEGVCIGVFRVCLKTGVWDARAAFPYGGARITAMTRQ